MPISSKALAAPNDAGLRALFPPDCHWRDVLALTWTIQTLSGRDAVVSALKQWAARAGPKGFRIAENRTPPRRVTRGGTETIEAILAFETDGGRCNGVVRLIEDGGAPKAWTLLTALDQTSASCSDETFSLWQVVGKAQPASAQALERVVTHEVDNSTWWTRASSPRAAR